MYGKEPNNDRSLIRLNPLPSHLLFNVCYVWLTAHQQSDALLIWTRAQQQYGEVAEHSAAYWKPFKKGRGGLFILTQPSFYLT